jgi:hypothetical protein
VVNHQEEEMKRTLLSMAVALFGSMLVAGTADARGMAALAGRAGTGSNERCFDVSSQGRVSNSIPQACGIQSWFMSLDVDSNGGKTINVGFIDGSQNTTTSGCQSAAFHHDGSGGLFSMFKKPTVVGGFSNLSLTGSTVSSQDMLFVQCNLNQGDTLTQIDWNN